MDWTAYLHHWFLCCDVRLIKKGNLRDMLAYGLFYSTPCAAGVSNGLKGF